MFRYSKLKILIGIVVLFFPFFIFAKTVGEKVNFFVDSSYDLNNRLQLSATLQKATAKLYFYVDDVWWSSLTAERQREIDSILDSLGAEFDYKIYSTLTSIFGSEPKPGIDNDERITVLFHSMKEGVGGYFSTANLYSRLQIPTSNEREMIYLNSRHIDEAIAKIHLAHEFLHLITFNQKEKMRGVSEEIWLNEARSEYAPTIMRYDDVYLQSNLKRRIENFLEDPTDSLTEWRNQRKDYGVVNLFTQYLVDHYGLKILVDSLYSNKIGIPSINEALSKNGFKEDFSQIFTDWTIAVLVNDCKLAPLDSEHLTGWSSKYCYLNSHLKNFRISPSINFLPLVGESSLSINQAIPPWSGNWQKIIGGKGTLVLEFDGEDTATFKVPYFVCDYQEKCALEFLNLDQNQKGKITLPEFNTKYKSLTIIPSVQTKLSGFDGIEKNYSFSWKVSIGGKTEEEKEAELRQKLISQIEFLKKEIARIQAEIEAAISQRAKTISCKKLEKNLHFGTMNDSDVRCLQEFLKSQGPEIYPEGLITGNFLTLTEKAVIRFQERFAEEILASWNLTEGTGIVGKTTRDKINKILEAKTP